MLTIFTTPKPFRGHIATIQGNALRSWAALHPACDVVVFGDEEGTAQAAATLGLRHVPSVARNEFGMPLVKDLLEHAQRAAPPFLCYANADIVFMDDLTAALARLTALREPFLMIGQRYNARVDEPLSFGTGWQQALRDRVIEEGIRLGYGIDYFVFPNGLLTDVPADLVVGRAGWDNWPVYEARLRKALVVDVTQVVMAVHQDHDYSHHPDGQRGVFKGVEAQRNYRIVGGLQNALTVQDATHILDEDGIRLRCRSCYPMCVCKPISF
jgi:hypothetical protein